jgi:aspartyl/glutamyl-tRNA(Asn/Gln) amidotransferase C subunit
VINVAKLARLACIGLTPAEEASFADELATMVSYVERLHEVEVAGVEPPSVPVVTVDLVDRRERKLWPMVSAETFLLSAPEVVGREIKVPQIVEM